MAATSVRCAAWYSRSTTAAYTQVSTEGSPSVSKMTPSATGSGSSSATTGVVTLVSVSLKPPENTSQSASLYCVCTRYCPACGASVCQSSASAQ